jgi:5-methylthioadenosine/S-adenosylhomocysteine deaminase
MPETDLGIRCDYLITMSSDQPQVQRDQFIGITGSKITEVGPWKNQSASTFVHARNRAVLPGMVNGHSHLAMTLFKGLADDLPFQKWLHDYILPLESKLVNPDFVKTGTELAALELIRFGVTTVCDSYFHMDVAGNALDRAGLRAIISECITDFPAPDKREDPGGDFRILDQIKERYSKHETITASLAPHAPYSVSDDLFRKSAEYSRKHGMLMNIHVSETAFEVQQSLEKYKKTPVARLHDLGVMNSPCVFAHCVHLTNEDMSLMAKCNTGVIHNPESNMKLSAGTAPVIQMLKHKLNVGLGTDGAASNNNLGMFHEMDTAAKLQKLAGHDNSIITAYEVLRFATLGGACALGLGDKIGSIESGKFADLIIVDLSEAHMQPVHNVLSQLVYSASGQEVCTVICNGQILFDAGDYKTLEPEAIIKNSQRWRDNIQKSLGQ